MIRFMPVSADKLEHGRWYLLLSTGGHWYWVRWLSTGEEGCRFEEWEREEEQQDMTVSCRIENMMGGGGGKRFLIRPDDFLGRVFVWDRGERRERNRQPEPPPDDTAPGP